MADTVADVNVPQQQVVVPASTNRPNVRFAPAYRIKMTDTVTVSISLNGVEQKAWSYRPTIAPAAGYALNLVAKLAIEEVAIPEV